MNRMPLFLLGVAFAATACADDWPQWMGPNRDGRWNETGIVERLPAEGPKVLWRAPIAMGYAGPAVAGDRVLVADFVPENFNKENYGLGGPADFQRSALEGTERVLCFDAEGGTLLWSHARPCTYDMAYPGGPRCTPTVHAGKVYALGAMGNLACFDAEKGTLLWEKDFPKEYGVKVPLYGFCGHPLVVDDKLVCTVGGEGTTVVAFDRETGREIWRALSSTETGYSAPTLIEAGGVRQVVVWHGQGIESVDPESGRCYWSYPLAPWMGVVVMSPRQEGDFLFAGTVFGTAVGLRLDADKPGVAEAWRGAIKDTGLFPMNMTPFVENGVMYGIDQPGQLRAVKMATGERLWESWLPVTGKEKSRPVFCGTAFIVKNGDRFFLFNEKGELLIARMSPEGYEEISRAKLLDVTGIAGGREVLWSHPAFARRCVFARNDQELVCASLAEE